MSHQSCQTCLFYRPDEKSPLGDVPDGHGICRGGPPVIVVLPSMKRDVTINPVTNQPVATMVPLNNIKSVYPIVLGRDEGCGWYEADPDKLKPEYNI